MKTIVTKAKGFMNDFWANLSRRFDFTLSLRRKKTDKNPLVSVNIKGEIPREVVAFFAILGVFTALISLINLIRLLRKL